GLRIGGDLSVGRASSGPLVRRSPAPEACATGTDVRKRIAGKAVATPAAPDRRQGEGFGGGRGGRPEGTRPRGRPAGRGEVPRLRAGAGDQLVPGPRPQPSRLAERIQA